MKLYVIKDGHSYVDVVVDTNYLRRRKMEACFRSYEKAHRGRIGTIMLKSDSDVATVAHEIVHVSMYYIQAYADDKVRKMSDEDLDDYIHETSAYIVEHMLRQYLTKVG
jgi:hypothetical protein